MTVLSCRLCKRYISVSYHPHGNPVALAEPEKWAVVFAECKTCRTCVCDRCIGDSQRCPLCEGKVTMHRPGDGFAFELAR